MGNDDIEDYEDEHPPFIQSKAYDPMIDSTPPLNTSAYGKPPANHRIMAHGKIRTSPSCVLLLTCIGRKPQHP